MGEGLFRFFIADEKNRVSTDSDLWKLPLVPDSGLKTASKSQNAPDITIGAYFAAAVRFLSSHRYAYLKNGLASLLDRAVGAEEIFRLDLFLVKHGAYYHPIKLAVVLHDDTRCRFTVNGAVSQKGLALFQAEYQLIDHLNRRFIPSYLPCVFGTQLLEVNSVAYGFFLGQWFNGFKEFHLTCVEGLRKIAIWDSNGDITFITEEEAFPIYREAARILTLYYDLEAFTQISPWHHAAGDFIIRKSSMGFDVRLITVRGYDNLTDFDPRDSQGTMIFPALLLFFLNLTVRIRLDRLDGTGVPALVSESVLPDVVEGFFQGLGEKNKTCPEVRLADEFIDFFNGFSMAQVLSVLENIAGSSLFDELEKSRIRKLLKPHCHAICDIFQSI